MNNIKWDCNTCRFSYPLISDNPDQGPIMKCRRFPPQIFVHDGDVTQGYPDAHDGCGEWRPDTISPAPGADEAFDA